jgi:glycosyltransferase involved in cell wall biosynthesis
MRFLMLNWRDPRNPLAGGAERVTLGYLAALAQRGHDVWWFANHFEGASPEDGIEGVRIVRGGGIGTSIWQARRWYRRQVGFDLVMDQHHGIPWYAPWWCRTRCVAYIHEVLGPIWNAFYSWPVNVIGRWQERWTHWLYRRVPFWTACQGTRDLLRQHGVRDVTIIPYGVHTVALPELEAKPLATPLRLVVVSRLAPNKRVDHTIRAIQSLRERGVPANLKIVGSGEMDSQLRRLVAELNLGKQVTFLGALSEPEKDRCLREAHFLLHASQREGWGLNIIEANALGTPAAVYPVAGLMEATLHDETGLVGKSETPEALAQALAGALNSLERYQFYRLNAWRRAKTFHWDVVLPKACEWLENQARDSAGKAA